MKKLKKRFTLWYIRRGYTFRTVEGEGVWDCPWWVRPMLFLFSPSVYFTECDFVRKIVQGIMSGFAGVDASLNEGLKGLHAALAEFGENLKRGIEEAYGGKTSGPVFMDDCMDEISKK